MKFLILLILLCGCSTFKPPNNDFCVKHKDGTQHCAWDIQGDDFSIDNTGNNNYTLYGQNLTADQFDAVAIRMSPWSYAVLKKSFLNWCHAKQSNCQYPQAVQAIEYFEDSIGINRLIVPYWTDQMLDVIVEQ